MLSQDSNIIIIGPSGSGKGTQAEFIAETYGQEQLITSDALKKLARNNSNLGRLVKEKMAQGFFLDDDIVNQVVLQQIKTVPQSQGVVVDGSPRSIGQAEFLEKIFAELNRKMPLVVNLNVSEKSVIFRLINRRMCEKCGELYHPPKSLSLKLCEKCGGKLIKREDDNEEAIQKRLKEYREKVTPVIDFYRARNRLIDIDGEPEIEKVSQEIKEKLKNYDR
jgi:adenylate kinase